LLLSNNFDQVVQKNVPLPKDSDGLRLRR